MWYKAVQCVAAAAVQCAILGGGGQGCIGRGGKGGGSEGGVDRGTPPPRVSNPKTEKIIFPCHRGNVVRRS